MKVGGDVAEWMATWDSKLLRATWLGPEGPVIRQDQIGLNVLLIKFSLLPETHVILLH